MGMGSTVYGGMVMSRLRVATLNWASSRPSALMCRCRAYNGHGGRDDGNSSDNGNGSGRRFPPQDALLRALSGVSRTDGRVAKSLNVVLGGYMPEDQWRALDETVNLYPMVRRFTAIGNGGDDFAHAMVVAVETVLQSPIPRAWVTKRLSSKGKYISVRIGPVLVNSSDQYEGTPLELVCLVLAGQSCVQCHEERCQNEIFPVECSGVGNSTPKFVHKLVITARRGFLLLLKGVNILPAPSALAKSSPNPHLPERLL